MQAARADESVSHLLRDVPSSGTFTKTPTSSLLAELHRQRDDHPIWRSRFLRLIAAGALTKDDLRHVFGQYYHYSRNFTRYVAAVMARCPSDYFRARLSENLWDEGGGAQPELRHAQLYRNFLADGLGLDDPDDIACESCTEKFVHDYFDFCMTAEPMACAAFLSLGTESIVSRLYSTFHQGLEKAGIDERSLAFFRVHVAVDDEHAVTLEQLMASYAHEPHWFETCARAANHALELRLRFFDDLTRSLQLRRVQDKLERIQNHVSLASPDPSERAILHHLDDEGEALYANCDERLCVDFKVAKVPFASEVLDPRIVRIAPHRRNERHRHAHETFYYVIRGSGRIAIDGTVIAVGPGDMAFVPRWSLHQTANDSEDTMIVLAVTDFHFSNRAHLGDHNPRMKQNGPPKP
jgi:pyrroloquinoline quinone (PQQ) biosynthesis protein C/quercetin dioxygenase-like cupin family protein